MSDRQIFDLALKERGYLFVDAIRAKIWENDRVRPFYRQNMLVFCDDRFLPRYPKLTQTQQHCTMPVRLVRPRHDLKLQPSPGLTVILKSFPRALYNAVARRSNRSGLLRCCGCCAHPGGRQ